MSGPKVEELRGRASASSQARVVDLAQLQLQIRRSRQELIDSLNSLPDALAEKKILEETASKTAEKKDLFLPLSVRKQDQRVLFQTATKEEVRREVLGSVRMSNSQEIQQVLYGDVSHPRSLSPDELPRQTTAVTQIRRQKDISQSMIISRANRNSLTPTKITFCYQSKPTGTVAYVANRQQTSSQRRDGHLKESFIKEIIERRTASPVDEQTSNPVILRTISTPITSVIRTTTVNTRPADSQFASVSSSSLERHRKEAAISCKFEAQGQRCKLCELTRSNLKGFREIRYSNIEQTFPGQIQRVDSDVIVTEGESHADAINASPGKESTKRYLSSEVKQQCRNSFEGNGVRKSRRQIFGSDFMGGIESRSKVIQSELTKLNQSATWTPVRALTVPDSSSLKIRGSTHTRKRIFPQKTVQKYIRIDQNQKLPGRLTSAEPVKSISNIQGFPKERNYSQIHSHLRNISPLIDNQRNAIVSPTFRNTVVTTAPVHYSNVIFRPPPQGERVVTVSQTQPVPNVIRTVSPGHNQRIVSTAPIIIERMVTQTRKDWPSSGAQEVEGGRLQYGLMSERNQFFKKDAEIVASKRVKIPDFQLTDMSVEVRSWFQSHKREIDYQSQRICSYDLIKRYMSDPDISVRLHKLITSQVEPKRWLLTMVDEVYAKLKDRYLPIHK